MAGNHFAGRDPSDRESLLAVATSGKVNDSHLDSSERVPASIVIAMRNEEESVAALVASLQAQTAVADEILLVDGGSTDDTVLRATAATRGDSRFRIIEAGAATPGRGRNVGIDAARNDLIAITDAGITLDPHWLEELLKAAARNPEAAIVYGNHEPVISSFYVRCAALAHLAPKHKTAEGFIRARSIASSLVQRSALRAVGGFPDLRAAEDMILMEKLDAAGFVAVHAPNATVHWELPDSFRATFRRFALYSHLNVELGRTHDWHRPVFRMYAITGALLLAALMHSPLWFVALFAGVAARVEKSILTRRHIPKPLAIWNPIQFVGVALVIATIDAATFVGWVKARLRGAARHQNV